MTHKTDDFVERWNLFPDTSVSVGDRWGSGLEVVLEREQHCEIGIGRVFDNPVPDDEQNRVFKLGIFSLDRGDPSTDCCAK